MRKSILRPLRLEIHAHAQAERAETGFRGGLVEVYPVAEAEVVGVVVQRRAYLPTHLEAFPVAAFLAEKGIGIGRGGTAHAAFILLLARQPKAEVKTRVRLHGHTVVYLYLVHRVDGNVQAEQILRGLQRDVLLREVVTVPPEAQAAARLHEERERARHMPRLYITERETVESLFEFTAFRRGLQDGTVLGETQAAPSASIMVASFQECHGLIRLAVPFTLPVAAGNELGVCRRHNEQAGEKGKYSCSFHRLLHF